MFIIDPKDKKESVTLTLFILSYLILLVMAGLKIFDKIDDISPFMNIFLVTSGLYLGRRTKFNKDVATIEVKND